MTKPIEVTHPQWNKLLSQLEKDYRPSDVLIRAKMKKTLGFTPREYKDWDKENNKWRKNCIMLDFYSEKKRTFFIMKYSEYLNEVNKNGV